MRCNGRRAAGKLQKWYTLKSFNPELRWTNTGSSWSMQGILKGRDLTLWHAKLILQASVSKSTGLVFSMLHWSSSSANRSHRTKIAPFLFLSLVLPEGKYPKGWQQPLRGRISKDKLGASSLLTDFMGIERGPKQPDPCPPAVQASGSTGLRLQEGWLRRSMSQAWDWKGICVLVFLVHRWVWVQDYWGGCLQKPWLLDDYSQMGTSLTHPFHAGDSTISRLQCWGKAHIQMSFKFHWQNKQFWWQQWQL